MSAPSARRVVVRGRVQGVSFRDGLRAEAETRDVTGWVRNRDDGAVEALLEGDPEALEALVAWCREGPPGAAVEGVEEGPVDPEGNSDFATG